MRSQNEAGVRWLGGVLIRSLAKWVYSAIISARLSAFFIAADEPNFDMSVALFSGAFCSAFVDPRNSVKLYAPSVIPSAIAANSALLE